MQAIVTVFRGPTNTRPARIYARASAGRLSVSYEHGLDELGNHIAAARALAEKFQWQSDWATGSLPNGDYVHVQHRSFERWSTIPAK